MQLTYMVRGADGQEYGPATLEQVSGWIREGRLPAKQEVRRSDMQGWAAADAFQELQDLYQTSTPPPSLSTAAASAPTGTPDAAPLLAQLRSGASWFYLVAALSLVNSIAAVSGANWRFFVGLGITQIFSELGAALGTSGKVIALLLDLIVTGMFILFGVMAGKRHSWAFITGMSLFALDSLLLLLVQDWVGIAFHAFVLFCLFRGLAACRALNRV